MAEWLRSGLQIRRPRFESGRGLQASHKISDPGNSDPPDDVTVPAASTVTLAGRCRLATNPPDSARVNQNTFSQASLEPTVHRTFRGTTVWGALSGRLPAHTLWILKTGGRFVKTILPLVCAALLVAGCAGRAPLLTQVVKASDRQLSCDQIVAEIDANNQQITNLAQEEGLKVTQNVVAGVAGLVVPVLWLGMDFQDAAGKEAQALSQRNDYLAKVAADSCGPARRS